MFAVQTAPGIATERGQNPAYGCNTLRLLDTRVLRADPDEYFGDPTFAAAPVSIFELIANGEEFHGWNVQVRGFANFQFEGAYLYATRDAFEQRDTASAIIISARTSSIEPSPWWTEVAEYSGAYVELEGIFENILRLRSSPNAVARTEISGAGELHTINSIVIFDDGAQD